MYLVSCQWHNVITPYYQIPHHNVLISGLFKMFHNALLSNLIQRAYHNVLMPSHHIVTKLTISKCSQIHTFENCNDFLYKITKGRSICQKCSPPTNYLEFCNHPPNLYLVNRRPEHFYPSFSHAIILQYEAHWAH